jgi:hypothetical protein
MPVVPETASASPRATAIWAPFVIPQWIISAGICTPLSLEMKIMRPQLASLIAGRKSRARRTPPRTLTSNRSTTVLQHLGNLVLRAEEGAGEIRRQRGVPAFPSQKVARRPATRLANWPDVASVIEAADND